MYVNINEILDFKGPSDPWWPNVATFIESKVAFPKGVSSLKL